MLQWQNTNTIILAARKSDGIFKYGFEEYNGEVLHGKGLIFSLVVQISILFFLLLLSCACADCLSDNAEEITSSSFALSFFFLKLTNWLTRNTF